MFHEDKDLLDNLSEDDSGVIQDTAGWKPGTVMIKIRISPGVDSHHACAHIHAYTGTQVCTHAPWVAYNHWLQVLAGDLMLSYDLLWFLLTCAAHT